MCLTLMYAADCIIGINNDFNVCFYEFTAACKKNSLNIKTSLEFCFLMTINVNLYDKLVT